MIFKFRRLLLRFERLSQLHYAFKTLAYAMINLRHYCPNLSHGRCMCFVFGAPRRDPARPFHAQTCSRRRKSSLRLPAPAVLRSPSATPHQIPIETRNQLGVSARVPL
jgi:hypothetical protein